MKAIKMTEDAAWKLIEEIGWGTKSKNYQALAKEWFAKLGATNMERLHNFVGAKVSELGKEVDEYEKSTGESLYCGSDDSFSDLRFHIVGLGRTEFLKCAGDPRNIQTRYNSGDYTESFDYMFMEPDLPRTQEQMETSRALLIKHVAEVEKQLAEVEHQLNTVRGCFDDVNRLLRQVMEDTEKSS